MSDLSDPRLREHYPILELQSTPPGWLIDVYHSATDAGVVITRLDIRQDPTAGTPRVGITATVLSNISLPEIRTQVIERLHLADQRLDEWRSATDPSDPTYELLARAATLAKQDAHNARDDTRRMPVGRQRAWADQAKEALEAAKQARHDNTDLSRILEDQWGLYPDGVKSRLRRLKERDYIRGRGRNLTKGKALDTWLAAPEESEKE